MSNSLRPHELQHSWPPCPSPTPGAYSNSCTSSHWCHPTISPSVIPFSSCLQSFPAPGYFPMSQFFTSGGQSFSFIISLSNEYSGLISFRMVWLALLAVQGIFKNLLQQPQFKSINSSLLSFLYSPTLNPYMTTEKKHSFDKTDLWWQSNVSASLYTS